MSLSYDERGLLKRGLKQWMTIFNKAVKDLDDEEPLREAEQPFLVAKLVGIEEVVCMLVKRVIGRQKTTEWGKQVSEGSLKVLRGLSLLEHFEKKRGHWPWREQEEAALRKLLEPKKEQFEQPGFNDDDIAFQVTLPPELYDEMTRAMLATPIHWNEIARRSFRAEIARLKKREGEKHDEVRVSDRGSDQER